MDTTIADTAIYPVYYLYGITQRQVDIYWDEYCPGGRSEHFTSSPASNCLHKMCIFLKGILNIFSFPSSQHLFSFPHVHVNVNGVIFNVVRFETGSLMLLVFKGDLALISGLLYFKEGSLFSCLLDGS